MKRTFLKAEWKKLLMVNYAVDKELLEKHLPCNTELDLWNDTCYVSLVGFMFLNTRIKGVKIPYHINFEEVNLRFYVRYNDKGEWKRGVVFIKEIVSKRALSLVANSVYGERYETLATGHKWHNDTEALSVEYKWRKRNNWHSIRARTKLVPTEILTGSEEEFITEHYWGYTKRSNTRTSEYGVEHPKWEVYEPLDYEINVNFEEVYGADFSFLDVETPKSVFLAEGSEIKVMHGRRI